MKIGVGIVTFQRFDMFKKCIESVFKHRGSVDEIIVVDDCSVKDREKYEEYFEQLSHMKIKCFINKTNSGVGASKNKILEYFKNRDYDYIFTIEDDMLILDSGVWGEYISASKEAEIEYLNFALHGPANIGGLIANLGNISLYPNSVGSFTLHTKKLIEEIGFYDENFVNAWEHVEYCYVASKADLTTPFWYFADIKDSAKYISEQEGSIEKSSIRPRSDWQDNINKGRAYFKEKHGIDIFEVPK